MEDDIGLEDSIQDLRLDPVDAGDTDDPQAMALYINDIMDHLKATEVTKAHTTL